MEAFKKLHSLLLVAKIALIIKDNLGISDATVAEYILSFQSKSSSLEEFTSMLKEAGGEFSQSMIDQIYNEAVKFNNEPTMLNNLEPSREILPAVSSVPEPRSVDDDRGRSRESLSLIPGSIHRGVVSNVMPYGAFITIGNRKNRTSGLLHKSRMHAPNDRAVSNILEPRQEIYVQIDRIAPDGKISLSTRDIDIETGELIDTSGFDVDERPAHRPAKKTRMSSPERWEVKQLIASGVLSSADYPDIDNDEAADEVDHSPSNSDNEVDGPQDIEINEDIPPFLAGYAKESRDLSPIRIIKAPEGTLNRAAMQGAINSSIRREERQQKLMEKVADDAEDDDTSEQYAPRFNSSATSVKKYTRQEINEQRKNLPVYEWKSTIIKAVKDNQFLIVIGETGSGKSTQITQYLAEAGFSDKGIIGCTQPRRVAAISVATRVAEEVGCRVGEEVGYTIRFEDVTSPYTEIKYMTDGMLQREILLDPLLTKYSVIMLDEAHERTIATDILFALLKKAAKKRPDLRIIVTSATLEASKFSEYFYKSNILYIKGRTHPVEILYSSEPEPDYLSMALLTVMQIHESEPPGDILVFLTGQEEIDTGVEMLRRKARTLPPGLLDLVVLPVYASLPSEMQTKIFDPAPRGSRKVVLATNIAETSITIDGIYYVIDTGFTKVNAFDPKLGMDSLVITPISQAQANQRAGRAGRTGPGKCYRLYTEQAFMVEMLPTSIPEIQRKNLANTVLLLKAMGINDLVHFDFMDPPPTNAVVGALEELYQLAALDEEGLLTRIGREMAEFPMEPALAKSLLTSVELKCSDELLTIIAMISVQGVFHRPKEKASQADSRKARFDDPHGDHFTLLNVFKSWQKNHKSDAWCHENFINSRSLRRAEDIRRQLISILRRYKMHVSSGANQTELITRCICAGFFRNTARRDPQEGYKTLLENTPVYMHPSSSLYSKQPSYVIYHTLMYTTKEYMHHTTSIEPKWLLEAAPHFFKAGDGTTVSKFKKSQKLQPLFSRINSEKGDWRAPRRGKR
ncbi:hypothetical protein CANCADRAFT_43522 [Tortispora caseinolytica NRRL Y-17796]|uniref:RNA helicase n=1 Tax=Tortispora caseinolytica NRRL Y-17796 TaxID=767744 RepID=A0A1E4TMF7_9ASCO|nr:hypothetical protein CANCADRAFT_43522 [Tortispora caseinolytica NRRL Y-17796]